MQISSARVLKYYLSHFDELKIENRFHFATRLHLWCQDPAAQPLLQTLKPWATGNGDAAAELRSLVETAKTAPAQGSKNASALRKPFFARYPNLKTYILALFRITFLRHIYGIDCRAIFFELFPKDEVLQTRDALLRDNEALAILSTHAINFLYLLDRVVMAGEPTFDAERFIGIGDAYYDDKNPIHLQLKIYLYTHCIIGETMFYYRAIPQDALTPYLQMMRELETLIDRHFADINLDNKFEFLVCAAITGFSTKLQGRIMEEAERSVSLEGDFLIDRHNNNPQTANSTLDKSEHRNVLFVMSQRPFTPLVH